MQKTRSSLLDRPPMWALDWMLSRLPEFGHEWMQRLARARKTELVTREELPDAEPLRELLATWERGVENHAPVWDVYTRPEYLAELWACWAVYSRRYLRELEAKHIVDEIGDVSHVVDLGCGLGLTTAALTELFPNAWVDATEWPGSHQFRLANDMAQAYEFDISTELTAIDETTDVVFASEYFEHFERPVDHLCDVVEHLKPTWLIEASTFSQFAVGHFHEYGDGLEEVSGKTVAKSFRAQLASYGYEQESTTLWNNRPAIWRRR